MKRLLIPVLVLLLVGYLAFAEGAPKGGDFGLQGGLNFTARYCCRQCRSKVLFHG